MKKYKTSTIHYYPHHSGYLKTVCGLVWGEIPEHTKEIKFVSCKKCLKKIQNNAD